MTKVVCDYLRPNCNAMFMYLLITANHLADRYISDRCLPDKAIDLIDEASAQLKMEVTSKPQVVEEAEAERWQLR